LCNRTAERVRVHVVDESPTSVDLDDRDPLAIFRLEPGVAVDRDLAQLEADLAPRRADDTAGRLAEMAAGRGVQDDFGYG
jgi:hypothetical protein